MGDGGRSPGGGPDRSVPKATTYADSGVDLDAGDLAVEAIKSKVESTRRAEVVSGFGGFGALFALGRYDNPILVSSTDGVGTKSLIAAAMGRLSTIGIDLVAMCVDDLVCQGAEPLFMLDYLAMGRVRPMRVEAVVEGVAEGCRRAGCALVGGETAEHPDLLGPDHFDLAGFAVGVVEGDKLIGPAVVSPGDALVGLRSPGLRCNGYSLVRKVLLGETDPLAVRAALEGPAWPGAHSSLADELLAPSVIYSPSVLAAMGTIEVHAAAHITGGGIPGNLSRALPGVCDATVRRGAWPVPPIFEVVETKGGIARNEMERVFNLGVGMILVVPDAEANRTVELLVDIGQPSDVVGKVVSGSGRVRMEG